MSIVTEVRFAHENGALADTLSRSPDLTVSVIQESSTNPERDLYFMRFDSGGDDDIRETLDADSTITGVELMPGVEDQPVFGIEFAPETMLMAPRVTSQDGFVLDARSSPNVTPELDGWRERWLLPHREALQTIWQWAHEAGFEFDVVTFHKRGRADLEHAGVDDLTEEQREAIVAAYEQGYFTEPRETSLEELADSLGLSATAVSRRIRRGMKSTIETTLMTEYPE
jgi:glycerophosphoryl diester phosphodiesterase